MRLLLLLVFLSELTSGCYTGGYNSIFDGQCLYRHTNRQVNYNDAKNTCDAEDSHLLVLKTQSDQEQYKAGYNYNAAWLDSVCNGNNFVWQDGAIATYTNFQSAEVCNSSNVNRRYYISGGSGPSDGYWHSVTDYNGNSFYPQCQANVISWICDTYHLLQQGKSIDTCYLFDSTFTVLSQAESTCENQRAYVTPIHDQSLNDFVKRTAISNGITNGVHLGLHYVNDRYVWSDGSEVDYTNFAPGFPDTSFGECIAMGINLFPGKWMNVDCATPLPYMCIKPALSYDETVAPAGCSDDDSEFYPGDEIYSPTWGSATGPAMCDYALMDLDKTKKVTVEIDFFESNECCDTLTIYDGLFATKVLKTITGYYGLTSIIVTGTTNAIRMEWNAKSGAHVRGWHAKVTSA